MVYDAVGFEQNDEKGRQLVRKKEVVLSIVWQSVVQIIKLFSNPNQFNSLNWFFFLQLRVQSFLVSQGLLYLMNTKIYV